MPRKAGFDSFVRYAGSRYSLPPDYAGQRVLIGPRESRIVIQVENRIVAGHDPTPHNGATIAAPEHLAALWRLALAQAETPPPNWQIHFDQPVAAAPLSAYQDVCQEACR